MKRDKVIGVDVGGTNTSVALIKNSLDIIRQTEFKTPRDPSAASRRIKEEAEKLDPDGQIPLGIALCGLLSGDGRTLLTAPNLKWNNLNLAKLFGWVGSCFIALNDGTAAAWACYTSESGRKVQGLLSITLGTGVGGGMVMDGNLVFGAGELGHIKLDPEGPLCGCGRRGCLESYVGGAFIPARAREWFGLKVESANELYLLAENGDRKALECWKKIGYILGYSLSGVVNLNGIKEISLGGRIATSAGKFFLDTLEQTLSENLMVPDYQAVEVRISRWEHNMSLAGAAAVIISPPENSSGRFIYPKPE